MEKLKCRNCNKELDTSMEVEYSTECNEFFCSPDCATNYYFDIMRSSCVDFDNLPEDDVVVKNGKLYRND